MAKVIISKLVLLLGTQPTSEVCTIGTVLPGILCYCQIKQACLAESFVGFEETEGPILSYFPAVPIAAAIAAVPMGYLLHLAVE